MMDWLHILALRCTFDSTRTSVRFSTNACTLQEVLVQPLLREQIHPARLCTAAQGSDPSGHLNNSGVTPFIWSLFCLAFCITFSLLPTGPTGSQTVQKMFVYWPWIGMVAVCTLITAVLTLKLARYNSLNFGSNRFMTRVRFPQTKIHEQHPQFASEVKVENYKVSNYNLK